MTTGTGTVPSELEANPNSDRAELQASNGPNRYLDNGFRTSLSVINRIGLPNIDAFMQETPSQSPFQYPPDPRHLPSAGMTTPVNKDISTASLQTHIRGSGGRVSSDKNASEPKKQSSKVNASSAVNGTQMHAPVPLPSPPLSADSQTQQYLRVDFPVGPRSRSRRTKSSTKPPKAPPVNDGDVDGQPARNSKERQRRQRSSTSSHARKGDQSRDQDVQIPAAAMAPHSDMTQGNAAMQAQPRSHDPGAKRRSSRRGTDALKNPQQKMITGNNSDSQNENTAGQAQYISELRQSTRSRPSREAVITQLTRSKSESKDMDTLKYPQIQVNGKPDAFDHEKKDSYPSSRGSQPPYELRPRRYSIGGSSIASVSAHRSKRGNRPDMSTTSSQPWHRVDAEGDIVSNPNLLDDMNRLRNSYLDTQSFDMEHLPGTPPRNVSIYLVKAKDDPDTYEQPEQQQQQHNNPAVGPYHPGHPNRTMYPPLNGPNGYPPQVRQKLSMPEPPRHPNDYYVHPPHIGAAGNYQYHADYYPHPHGHGYNNVSMQYGAPVMYTGPIPQNGYGAPVANQPLPGATFGPEPAYPPISAPVATTHNSYPPQPAPEQLHRPPAGKTAKEDDSRDRKNKQRKSRTSPKQKPKGSQNGDQYGTSKPAQISAPPNTDAPQQLVEPGFHVYPPNATAHGPTPTPYYAYSDGPHIVQQVPPPPQMQVQGPGQEIGHVYFDPVGQGANNQRANPQALHYPYGPGPTLYHPPQHFPRPSPDTPFWHILRFPYWRKKRSKRQGRRHWWNHQEQQQQQQQQQQQSNSKNQSAHHQTPYGSETSGNSNSSNSNSKKKPSVPGGISRNGDVITCDCGYILLAPFRCLFACIGTLCSPCAECVCGADDPRKHR